MTSTRWDNDDDYSVPTIFELTEYLKKLNEDQGKNWYKIKECEKYLGWLEACPNLDCPPFGTPFAAIFGPGCTEDATTTMMQALWLDDTPPLPPNGLGGPSPVLAHSAARSEEHTSELQSLMRIPYAVFCLQKKKYITYHN